MNDIRMIYEVFPQQKTPHTSTTRKWKIQSKSITFPKIWSILTILWLLNIHFKITSNCDSMLLFFHMVSLCFNNMGPIFSCGHVLKNKFLYKLSQVFMKQFYLCGNVGKLHIFVEVSLKFVIFLLYLKKFWVRGILSKCFKKKKEKKEKVMLYSFQPLFQNMKMCK